MVRMVNAEMVKYIWVYLYDRGEYMYVWSFLFIGIKQDGNFKTKQIWLIVMKSREFRGKIGESRENQEKVGESREMSKK